MTLGPHLLGRTEPEDQRHVELHPFTAPAPGTVEVMLRIPTLSLYNQLRTPRCVGFAFSKRMNYLNQYAFDANWLYDECKKRDGDPTGDGTSARYACDVLRELGHWRTIGGNRVKLGPQRAHGIASNSWATTVDQIRAVFAGQGAAVQPVSLGIPWLHDWFTPQENTDYEYDLQDVATAGPIDGWHEIDAFCCSDRRQALGLSNTWGSAAPRIVWLSYKTMEWCFAQGADASIVNDLPTR